MQVVVTRKQLKVRDPFRRHVEIRFSEDAFVSALERVAKNCGVINTVFMNDGQEY